MTVKYAPTLAEQIVELVNATGAKTTRELADHFGVSVQTIHKATVAAETAGKLVGEPAASKTAIRWGVRRQQN